MASRDSRQEPRTFRVLLLRLATTWLLIPLLVAALDASLNWLFFVPVEIVLSLAWVVLGLVSAGWSVQYVRKRAWLYGLVCLILPAVMLPSIVQQSVVQQKLLRQVGVPRGEMSPVVILLAMGTLLEPAVHVGDVAHFFAVKPSYDKEIGMLPSDGSRFYEFNWGGMLFASKGVVYDETDQIVMPKDRRSASWLARVKETDLMCGGSELVAPVRPLWSHYYLAYFGC
ncbi:MAG: hypothetical protein M3N13_07625 [Candidatus Eremiobacteraeota bacterium]|nr:hypothetical protein [Candidatus Eremiobacteraeota bacterium]